MQNNKANSGSFALNDTLEKKLKVLVVDDEPIQLETIRRGLLLNDFDCVTARDACTALKILEGAEGGSFDVLLTDMNMPGDCGGDLYEQARRVRPDLPVVMITGLAWTPAIESLRQMGLPIVQKPFDPDELVRALKEVASA
ncbi:MAG: response regulator [Deltaproteobacteria bacterium]|nr:response regulator [Deltaproteobacteria bacterium]MCB9489638.1 response regulator [Deltaproteobacteria bacterium]